MYVTKDKTLAINTDLVQTARLASDGSVTLSLGTNTVTLDGDDADAAAKSFGLGVAPSTPPAHDPPLHGDDKGQKTGKEPKDVDEMPPQTHAQHQPAKGRS